METFRFGIMGAGRIAEKFCDAVRRIDGVKVAAVASKSAERAQTFAARNGIASWHADYGEMLAREDIDAVYIATTHNFHYENILECLEYGKPVLCEKCMVLTKRQAEEVFARAREKKLFVMEAMWSRFLPTIRKARQWIEEGRIGRVTMANACLGWVAPQDTENRMFNPDLAGGALYDMGVYCIEIMSGLIGGGVRKVRSDIVFAETGVDKSDCITLEFDDCLASLQISIAAQIEECAYLYGTRGYIRIPAFHKGRGCFLYGPDGNLVEKFDDPTENGFVYEAEEVVRCVRAGRLESDVMPAEDTIRCAEIFDLCLAKDAAAGTRGI